MTRDAGAVRRYAPFVVIVAATVGLLLLGNQPSGDDAPAPGTVATTVDPAWSALDAEGRCAEAVTLVTYPEHWPMVCRWREPNERLQGQAFPPPPGRPPYDNPHVQIYVAPTQTREEVARAIAHEFGHMHHTRDFRRLTEWLAARNLDAGTPTNIWTEDYAEVFAALFAPPGERWRAPTPRPTPEALADLRARFFS